MKVVGYSAAVVATSSAAERQDSLGFRCCQARLVMYKQDLGRTRDDVGRVVEADAGGRSVGSGWVLCANSHGEQVLVQPVRALRTHGSGQEVQSHNQKRSSCGWTQFFSP